MGRWEEEREKQRAKVNNKETAECAWEAEEGGTLTDRTEERARQRVMESEQQFEYKKTDQWPQTVRGTYRERE